MSIQSEFEIRPLGGVIGAEVLNFDPAQHAGEADRLVAAWIEHVVLVFRGQSNEPGRLLDIATLFGNPVRQPLQRPEYQVPGYPALRLLSNLHLDTAGDGQPLRIGGTWHTDHSHFPVPPRATMLQAVKLPSRGGDTCFSNQRAAYLALSEKDRMHIDSLVANHVYNSRFTPRRMPKISAAEKAEQPSASHPVARPHPVSGDRAIYLNPVRVDSIDGMDDASAMQLVSELVEHSTQDKFVYRHSWREGDIIIWDNRQAMHMVNHDYPDDEERVMRRTLIEGP